MILNSEDSTQYCDDCSDDAFGCGEESLHGGGHGVGAFCCGLLDGNGFSTYSIDSTVEVQL